MQKSAAQNDVQTEEYRLEWRLSEYKRNAEFQEYGKEWSTKKVRVRL